MSAAVTIVALPVAYAVLAALLRSPLGGRLVAEPTGARWHDRVTPTFGGIGIFAGALAGVGIAVATGALDASRELAGILAGAAIVFAAGLWDDLRHLSPPVKLTAQVAAAGIAIAAGLRVELVENGWVGTAVALLWLVGITNAFNLLDNMDGLAATLAAVACLYFAVDAATVHENTLVFVLALSVAFAALGFLPFNLRPRRRAAVFMGDSGSQLLGFSLAALGLAASWTTAGTTVAAMLLPLLVLAVPILDTTLVTAVRLLERRPVTQGGRDHTSHRLVYYGLSETTAVAVLASISIALGATAVAYNVLDNERVTAVGVLVTMVLLVQFASFLTDLEESTRTGEAAPSLRRALLEPRRVLEVVVDFVLMCGSFLGAYLLVIGGTGDDVQKAAFLGSLPVVLAVRYLAFTLAGVYRRVWRFAGVGDATAIAVAVAVSGALAWVVVDLVRGLAAMPVSVFVLDAALCTAAVGGSRLAFRAGVEALASARGRTGRRVLIVGAGRSGRSLARELRETPGRRVVGFVDDNPGVKRRRLSGVTVLGGLADIERVATAARPDEIVVTIPDAAGERLGAVVRYAREADIPCRFVRREVASEPPAAVEAHVS